MSSLDADRQRNYDGDASNCRISTTPLKPAQLNRASLSVYARCFHENVAQFDTKEVLRGLFRYHAAGGEVLANNFVSFAAVEGCTTSNDSVAVSSRCLCGLSKSRFSIAHDSYRMSIRTTVDRDPKLLKGQRRQTMEGQMGGSPKALHQHLAGETSLLGDYWSPTAVARVPVTS